MLIHTKIDNYDHIPYRPNNQKLFIILSSSIFFHFLQQCFLFIIYKLEFDGEKEQSTLIGVDALEEKKIGL